MNIFDFLNDLSKENFKFTLSYLDIQNLIEVHVDVYTEQWVATFGKDGFSNHAVFRNIEVRDDECSANLESLFGRPIKILQRAAEDLDFEIIAPYTFSGKNGEILQVTGLLPQFGNGTLLISQMDSEKAIEQVGQLEKYSESYMGPQYFRQYNRRMIMDLIEDWGWTSDDEAPAWYKGKLT